MLYLPVSEPTVPPHQVTSIDEILDYAERTYSFHSPHGVCGGPKAMVREFMQVLLEGRGSKDYTSVTLEPAVQAAVDDLDAAIDYGFLGLRASAAVFSLWPAMARAYECIAQIVGAWPSVGTASFATLREGMRANSESLKRTAFAHETWRASHDSAYAYTYQQCGRGIPGLAGASGLDVLLAPAWTSEHRQAEAELQDILRSRFELVGDASEALVLDLSHCIMDFLLRGQQVLRTAVTAQNDINRLLGRERPKRPFSAADIDVYFLIQGESDRLPYLIDELERLLAIDIDFNVDRLVIARRDPAA
jgi:hypothetical protein